MNKGFTTHYLFIKRTTRLSLLLLLCLACQVVRAQLPDANTCVTNSSVNTIATDGTYTYVGGGFTYVGQNTGYGGKLTSTSSVSNLAFAKVNGAILVAVPDGAGGWYIGGEFTQVGTVTRNFIAHIVSNGTLDATWNPNSNSYVYAITVSGSDIYVGGEFSSIGGYTRNRIAKLNNTNGNADGTWDANASAAVRTIATSGSDIYAGGDFTSIGGQTRNYIAKLNNTNGNADITWNANANNIVRTIAVNGTDIYATGHFTNIGGQTRNYIARLNNTNGNADLTWDPNANSTVYAMVFSGPDIYAGGEFTSIGGQSRNRIAKLSTTNSSADVTWNPNADNAVWAIALSGTDIYAGGSFTSIGGQSRNRIAKLNNTDGTANLAWDANAASAVQTIAINNQDIYIGGYFNSLNGKARNRIFRFSNASGVVDATWNPNANSTVSAIAISGSDIYVGGSFTSVGGQSRGRIAKLNDTDGSADATWNPSSDNTVLTIAISGSDVYVGGAFSSIGGQARNRIAKLASSGAGSADATWNPNSGNTVNTITIDGTDVYVGGTFTSIGGQSRSRIAKLASTGAGSADATWNPNASSTISTISIDGTDVYVGGAFNSIGGQTRSRIAKLTSTGAGSADATWNPSANSTVNTIAISGTDVYAGGAFTSIGGQSRNRIAKLTSTGTGSADATWNPSANNTVLAIAVSGSGVYAGGNFATIGGQAQRGVAHFFTNGYTWTGAIDNDYNTAGNWDQNAVPSGTDMVIIPAGAANPPNLNNVNFSAASFIQNSGQTLTLGTGNMSISDAFTNNGTITGTGKVVLDGSSTQTIEGTGTVTNLELNNSAGAIISSGSNRVNLTGLLSLTSGQLTTNGNLTLKSTSPTATAMVGPVAGTLSGDVVIERYFSEPANPGNTGRAWRLMTVPAKGTSNTSIFYNWQNNGSTVANTGIEVWGPTGTGSGGNGLAQGSSASMRSYDGATNTYVPVTNTKTTDLFSSSINHPYLIFGSGSYNSGNVAAGADPSTLQATGEVITGTQTYNFTPPNGTNKLQLIGNPYPCPIDFDKVYLNGGTSNINRQFWAVDPNLNNVGAYVVVAWDGISAYTVTPPSSQNQYIQSGQAFFVQAAATSLATVDIEENDKETSAAQTAVFRTNGGNMESVRINLNKVVNSVPALVDGAVVNCHQNLSNTIGNGDAGKFTNFNENISILYGTQKLAIEGRQLLDQGDSIKIALSGMQQTSYQLEFQPGNINAPGLTAVLYDNFQNTSAPISLTANTVYPFTVTSNTASSSNSRFVIAFSNSTPLAVTFISVNAQKKNDAVEVAWRVANETGTTQYEIERSADGKDFSRLGIVETNDNNDYSYDDEAPLPGNNYYRINAVARSNAGVYSNTVKVNMSNTTPTLSTYPNPVTGGKLQLHLSNLSEGIYFIRIYNSIGQESGAKQISYSGGSSVVSMDINTIAAGIYHVKLINEKGESISEQKIICQ